MAKKVIYQPTGLAEEYASYALNIYKGCSHGCTYCFAKDRADKRNECFIPVVRNDLINKVERSLKSLKRKGVTVHLCLTCDPYPYNADTSVTKTVIQMIKDSGNHVQILTKGGTRAMRDLELLDENDSVGITITGAPKNLDSTDSDMQTEPFADTAEDNIVYLKAAKEKGCHTWVSFEPIIQPEKIYDYITQLDYVDMLRFGALNYRKSSIDWKEVRKNIERICEQRGRKKGESYSFKSSLEF